MASRLLWARRAASYLRISTFHRGFSTVIKDLKYADTHEWVKVDGSSATVGIIYCFFDVRTFDQTLFVIYFQDHLGDVVYVELPEVGASVVQGKNFGAVESVKATSDVNSPVSGEVVEVNTELSGSPGLVSFGQVFLPLFYLRKKIEKGCCLCLNVIDEEHVEINLYLLKIFQVNASPYENGWIIKVKMSDTGELNSLMDSEKYSKFCEEEDAKH
ncbi:hypothetical protein GW17_00013525 [Ensete ventricosum]|nr:hypothetical protein GW17_00013525 [Ensete ventricosum]